ncbi:asparagine-linked glycosylation protein [Geranomyces variabilis]|nr:asparagine-linked glycosylation protein [Geranomyces variabilis]
MPPSAISLALACQPLLLLAIYAVWEIRLRSKRARDRAAILTTPRRAGPVVAFFHPFCDAGGGGERVLWMAIRAIQEQWPESVCVIYCRNSHAERAQVLAKVKSQFNLTIKDDALKFVPLKHYAWLEAKRYPFLTLLLQSLGSMVVAVEALEALVPDVFVDTIGFAFTYPLASWLYSCKVVAYVHYPTISSDMLRKVSSKEADFNHSAVVARSPLLTRLKKWYYIAFAMAYGFVGRRANVVMVNSTWTRNHINQIWSSPQPASVVFPPCDTLNLRTFPLVHRQRLIVSVAQFRPEKAHSLQLQAFSELLSAHPNFRDGSDMCRLVLIGGSRNEDDRRRAQELRDLAVTLRIEDNVEIVENASYPELQAYLAKASIGLHTMRDEHFGIGIVEYMAAGLIPVAHNSGGPKLDIVVDAPHSRTGFLATTAQEYSAAFATILELSDDAQRVIRERARASVVTKFSDATFARLLVENLATVMRPTFE